MATVVRRTAPLLAFLLAAWPVVIGAQQPGAMPTCDGSIVSSIVFERERPTVIGESAPEWARPFLSVALQHRTTRASALRPFLLLDEGEPCTEALRAESERLLRAQPYLADARIVATTDSSGGTHLEVTTVDEVPLVIGARVTRGRLSGVRYGSANAFGEGLYAAAEWREGFAYRDGIGVRFVNYHAFAQPMRFSLALARTSTSAHSALTVERPLLTSHQRFSWHAGLSDGSEYASFVRPQDAKIALALDRSRVDVGGTFRLGPAQRRIFAGPFVTAERVDPATQAVVISDTGFVIDSDPVLQGRFGSVQRTRVAGVVGVRLLSFARVEGFDALLGAQDVARGIQLATIAGRSFVSGGNGSVFGVDLYAGAGTARSFVAVRGQWEGDRQHDGSWADAIAGGRVAWYYKPTERRTLIVGGDFAGAWGARVPYQIPLGDQAGVRGYGDSRVMGARRFVARTEHRWMLGNVTRFMAVGAAAFVDAGAVWAGGVPYGQDSGIRSGAGVALLAAVPPRSRRTLRLDVAVPLVRDRDASYELRATLSSPLRMFWRDPAAIASIRTVVPASGVFTLP